MANLSNLITQTVGSSSGGVNLITAPSQSSIWTATGLTLSTTTTAAELPLGGFSNTAVKFALTGSTTSAYVDFDVPTALLNTKLAVQWYARASVTTIGNITLTLQSYASSANRTSNTSPTSVTLQTSSVASAAQSFQTTFDAASQQFFRLTLSFPAASGQWYSLAQMVVGPGQVVQGAAISEWQSYSATLGGTTADGTITYTSRNTQWRRVGSNMEIRGTIEVGTVTSSPTGFLRWFTPTGFTVAPGSEYICGDATFQGSSSIADLAVITQPSQPAAVLIITSSFGTTPALTTGALIKVNFSVPIAEWAGNGTVNLGPGAQVEYAWTVSTGWDSDQTSSSDTRYGPGGSQVTGLLNATRQKRVFFQYPIQADDLIALEFSNDGIVWTTGYSVLNSTPVLQYSNFTALGPGQAGAAAQRSGTNSVDVFFGRYQSARIDDGSNAANWSSGFWRLRKAKASSPVGFGLAGTDGSSGLYQAGRAPGLTTGAAIPAGMIGERQLGSLNATSGLTTNVIYNAGSISLSPGIWMIYTGACVTMSGGAQVTDWIADIDTTAGTLGAANSRGRASSAVTNIDLVVNPVRYVQPTTTTLYYLNVRATFTAGTAQWSQGGSYFFAVRIA